MSLKQKYLHEQGPFPVLFDQERVQVLTKIINIITACPPSDWNIRGLNVIGLLDSYKQVYGLVSSELTRLFQYFLGLLYAGGLTAECSTTILKALNRLQEFKITVSDLKVDNSYFLAVLKEQMESGLKFPLKNADSYMEELIKVIRNFTKYGGDCYQQALELAVKKRDNKYIALFIRSIKSEAVANEALDKIFAESSVWDRDSCFFYILDELLFKFPELPIHTYYQTLFQEIIKVITCVIDPSTEEEIKKLVNEDPCIGTNCILKSVANILVDLLRPTREPGWQVAWSCVQRIFSLIHSTMNHSHEVEFMNDFLIFMKQFVKAFIFRFRQQRKIHEIYNEDFIEEKHGELKEDTQYVIGEQYLHLFEEIWMPMIPQLLYLEDGDVRASKILSDLAMFQPSKYLLPILQHILLYLDKDLTIVSAYTPKMAILFLQEFIITGYPDCPEFSVLIECCSSLLTASEKLGVSQNLDILELIMRTYMYMNQSNLQTPIVTSLTEDIIRVLLTNMEAMSINLEGTEGDEAELYIDFRNIYIAFLLKLSPSQLRDFNDKILYKIQSKVPEHRQAYEFILVALCYIDPTLSKKVLDHSYKQIITTQPTNGNIAAQPSKTGIAGTVFPLHPECSLNIKNEQHLRWYASIIQCAYQYHPENIVRDWDRLETIVMVMLREWERNTIFQWGLDLIFNLVLGLSNVHMPAQEFNKCSSSKYQTIKGIEWKNTSPASLRLLLTIKQRFHDNLVSFVYQKYADVLPKAKCSSNELIRVDCYEEARKIQIEESMSRQLDSLLVPAVPSAEDSEEKRILNKILSIQYSIFSALQLRAPYLNEVDKMPELATFFLKELSGYRRESINYLKDVLWLLSHFNSLWNPEVLKVFHYFWREAHDQLFFSAAISATNEKLHPFFYPIQFRRKELFQNSFLILNEMYLTFMMRVELIANTYPVAYINNPDFLSQMVPFSFVSALECSIKSFLPMEVDPHSQYHAKLLDICRLKASVKNPNSYIIKYSESLKGESKNGEKEKYIGGMRSIINNFRKTQSILSCKCCAQDSTTWYTLVELLDVYPLLEKKQDRLILIEILYMIVIFTFDFKGYLIYQLNTASKEDTERKVAKYLELLLKKLREKDLTHKDSTAITLIMICFSELLPLHHPLHSQLTKIAFSLTFSDTISLNSMGKTFVFRILNRFIKERKVHVTKIPNTPVKRPFQDYLLYRHLGGEVDPHTLIPVPNVVSNKVDNYFYPLKQLKKVEMSHLNESDPNEKVLLDILHDPQQILKLFKALCKDTELKQDENEVDIPLISEQEPRRINANGHKLLNYVLDGNPQKMDIFFSFVDNFSVYPICFYHRLFRKMMVLGDKKSVNILKELAIKLSKSEEKEQVKLVQFILSELLPFSFDDQEFYEFYSEFFVNCSKQNFDFANNCLLVVFCTNWRVNKGIFQKIIGRLRAEKGPSRLRHFEVFNNFILCTGRFSMREAVHGITYLLQGIEQGSDEVSELIVSMLICCFIIPINLEGFPEWVEQPLSELIAKKKIYKLNECTGYDIHPSVKQILQQIVNKTKGEKNMASKNLKVYSKIAKKILSSITVYRFNDEFYSLLKEVIIFIVNNPVETVGEDDEIMMQLKDSEYPQEIFEDLVKELIKMDSHINVAKKKLKLLEGVVINRNFSNNNVQLPEIFSRNSDKHIGIDHVIAMSNMARIMKTGELERAVEEVMGKVKKGDDDKMEGVLVLMSLLLAAGNRPLGWREKVLQEILKLKKMKLVKEFVSYWWKGRSAETEEEQRLYMLVRGVENPYSYFA